MQREEQKSLDEEAEQYQVSAMSSMHSAGQSEVQNYFNPEKQNEYCQSNMGDLDSKDDLILKSIIRKIINSSSSGEISLQTLRNAEEELNEEQRQMLPKLIGRLRSKDNDPLTNLQENKNSSPTLEDPADLSTKFVVEQFKSKLHSKCEEIEELSSKVTILNEQNQKLKNTLIKSSEQSVAIECQFDEKQRKLEFQKDELEERYEEEIRRLNQKIDILADDHNSEVRNYQDQLEEEKVKTSQLEKEIKQLKGKNQEMQDIIEKNKSEIQTKTHSEIFEMKEEYSHEKEKLQQKLSIICEELQLTKCSLSEKNHLQVKIAEITKQLQETKQVNRNIEKEIEEQKLSNEKALTRQFEFVSEINDLKNKFLQVTQQMDEKNMKIVSLEKKTEQLSEISVLQDKISQHEFKLKQKDKECSEIQSKKSLFESELEKYKKKLQKVTQDKEKREKSLTKKLDKKEEQNKNLMLELQRCNNYIQDFKNDSVCLSNEVDELKKQLEQAELQRQSSLEQSFRLERSEEEHLQHIQMLKQNSLELEIKTIEQKQKLQSQIHAKSLILSRHQQKINELEQSFSFARRDSISFISQQAQNSCGQAKIKCFESFFKSLNNLIRKLNQEEKVLFRRKIGFIVST